MAKQTFIILLENSDGQIIDFERWSYKKVRTCIDNMVELYRTYPSLYVPKLQGADRVTAYPTPDGYNREAPVWSVSKDEFLKMVLKENAA